MRELLHEETICCGYKRCPTVRIYADGSLDISDEDVESGSFGVVKFTPEQSRKLLDRLIDKLPDLIFDR